MLSWNKGICFHISVKTDIAGKVKEMLKDINISNCVSRRLLKTSIKETTYQAFVYKWLKVFIFSLSGHSTIGLFLFARSSAPDYSEQWIVHSTRPFFRPSVLLRWFSAYILGLTFRGSSSNVFLCHYFLHQEEKEFFSLRFLKIYVWITSLQMFLSWTQII